jgi:hypothetical protein
MASRALPENSVIGTGLSPPLEDAVFQWPLIMVECPVKKDYQRKKKEPSFFAVPAEGTRYFGRKPHRLQNN